MGLVFIIYYPHVGSGNALSNRISTSIEMCYILTNIKNYNYKETKEGKTGRSGEWGWGFRRETLEFCLTVATCYNTPFQYGTPPTDGKYSFVSLLALLNSELFDKRDPILGKFATPLYSVPTYIFFE